MVGKWKSSDGSVKRSPISTSKRPTTRPHTTRAILAAPEVFAARGLELMVTPQSTARPHVDFNSVAVIPQPFALRVFLRIVALVIALPWGDAPVWAQIIPPGQEQLLAAMLGKD